MEGKYRMLPLCLVILLSLTSCLPKQEEKSKPEDPIGPTGEISFITNRDGNYEVNLMDADGKNRRNLTQNEALDYWSSWSPDGKQMLFYSKREGNNEIYVMDMLSQNSLNISNAASSETQPQWSPDGSKVLFSSNRDHSSNEIYVMDISGSNVVRLTQDSTYNESPSWSPDMRQILFTKQLRDAHDSTHAANGEIFVMDANGKNERRLTNKKGYDSGATYSPDGKKIAFYGATDEGNWDVFVMDADGNHRLNVTQDSLECYSPNWSPDGAWLAYTAGRGQEYDVWIIHLKTGFKKRLTHGPKRSQNPVWRPQSLEQ